MSTTYNARIGRKTRPAGVQRRARTVKVDDSPKVDHLAVTLERLQDGLEDLDVHGFLGNVAVNPRYSWRNQVLLWSACPGQRVAGFRVWADQGRSVKKGARAVRLLAPRRTVCVFAIADTDGVRVADTITVPAEILEHAEQLAIAGDWPNGLKVACELIAQWANSCDSCPACGWDGSDNGGCDSCRYA